MISLLSGSTLPILIGVVALAWAFLGPKPAAGTPAPAPAAGRGILDVLAGLSAKSGLAPHVETLTSILAALRAAPAMVETFRADLTAVADLLHRTVPPAAPPAPVPVAPVVPAELASILARIEAALTAAKAPH